MGISDLIKRGQNEVSENSNAILTGLGVVGVFTTSYLASKATLRAQVIIREENEKQSGLSEAMLEYGYGWTFTQKLKMVWKCYIPAAASALATSAAIIWAHRISARQAAAFATAYGISERAFQEYKEKIVEKFGDNKARTVKDEIAQKHVDNHPISKEVIIAGSGDVLCFDITTGRYFNSSVEEIKAAQNRINEKIINHMYASLSEFYDEIGLRPTPMSDELGWNTGRMLDLELSTTLAENGRPCITVDFVEPPFIFYNNLHE